MNTDKSRQIVSERLGVLDADTFTGSLGAIKERLDELAKEGVTHIRYEAERWWDCYEFTMCQYRLETDKERNKRLATEKKRQLAAKKAAQARKAKKEERERKQYEKLKAKYGGHEA